MLCPNKYPKFYPLLLSLVFLFSLCASSAAELWKQQPRENIPGEEIHPALKDVKSVKIIVTQSCSGIEDTINLPFRKIAADMLKYAGLNLVKDKVDLTVIIKAKGEVGFAPEPLFGHEATLSGSITFKKEDGSFTKTSSFKGSDIGVDGINSLFHHILSSFVTQFLQMEAEAFGICSVINALNNNNYYIRKDAASALIEIGAPAVDPLIAALKHKWWPVRTNAAKILGEIKDPRAVEPLINVLMNKTWFSKKEAEGILLDLNDQNEVVATIKVFREAWGDIRENAAIALGNIRDSRAVEPLIFSLKDKDDYIRKEASAALRKITGEEFGKNYLRWSVWWNQIQKTKKQENLYSSLLIKVLRGDKTVDFKDLRLAYTKTDEYDPYQYNFDMNVYEEMFDAFADKRYEQAIKKAEIILEDNFLDIDSHVICAESHKKIGNTNQFEYHDFMTKGLISSILDSGDGKSPETAYEVISIREEKAILKVLGYQLLRTALITHEGHHYDEIDVMDRKTGNKLKIYFNVDLPLKKAVPKKNDDFRPGSSYIYSKLNLLQG